MEFTIANSLLPARALRDHYTCYARAILVRSQVRVKIARILKTARDFLLISAMRLSKRRYRVIPLPPGVEAKRKKFQIFPETNVRSIKTPGSPANL